MSQIKFTGDDGSQLAMATAICNVYSPDQNTNYVIIVRNNKDVITEQYTNFIGTSINNTTKELLLTTLNDNYLHPC